MRRKLLTVLLVTAIVMSTLVAPNINIVKATAITEDTGWVAAYPNNNQNDYIEDQQTGAYTVSQDIVGTASEPSTFMRFSATEVDFRIRVNDIDGSGTDYEFKNFAFIGIDADLDGGIDFFLGIYNPTGNNGRLGIYGSADGYSNTSPSTTGIEGAPYMAFEPKDGINYTITEALSNIDGDADYFISFKFSLDDIAEALQGTGISFTSSTPFRFMTGTAAQDNSFNQDLNGMDGDGWSSDDTWNDLGVFTDVVSPDGSANYYIVNFDKNTGDNDASPQFFVVEVASSGDTVVGTLPTNNPTKRGMYFIEWNTAADGTGDKVTTATVLTDDTTFYAIWSHDPPADSFLVTFDANGGTFGTTTTVTVATIDGVVGTNMPADPTRSGKYFAGWEDPSGNYFNANTLVTADITVKAVWESNAVNEAVFYDNFDALGGSVYARWYSNPSGKFNESSLPTIAREGYIFGGWYVRQYGLHRHGTGGCSRCCGQPKPWHVLLCQVDCCFL